MTKKNIAKFKRAPTVAIFVLAFAIIGATILVFSKAATPNPNVGISATGDAALSLSPASGNFDNGKTFTLSIYESGGSDAIGVGSVDARLIYDAAKLTFVSINSTGGAFDTCPGPGVSGGNGTAMLGCTKLGGALKGSQKVGEVTFTAKVGSGSTSITFGGNSAILKGDGGSTDLWNGNTVGGTYSLTTPGTGGGTGGGGGGTTTPPPASGGSGSSTPSPTKSTPTTKPTVSNPTAPTNATSTTGGTAQQVSTATTYPVNISVYDKKGGVVAGAKVTINGQTVLSDANGVASFTGLAAGKYKVKIETADGTVTKEITVTASSDLQAFREDVKPSLNYIMYGAILAGVIVFFILVKVIKNWLHERAEHDRRFNSGVHVGGQEPEPTASIAPSKPADPIVNETVATVIAPKAEAEPGISLTPSATKHDIDPNETLDKIEEKVAAKKPDPVEPVKEKMISANEFEPNLIIPKKDNTLPPQAEKPA